jgi:hypothetical protein
MLTVLMIDDDPDVISTVEDQAKAANLGVTFEKETDFAQALQTLERIRPHVLILDVYRGAPVAGDAPGEAIWSQMWSAWFCPVVIYSAGEVEFGQAPPENHPFIKVVAKGAGTEQTVLGHVQAFAPHASALRDVLLEIASVANGVLRDVAPHVFTVTTDPEQRRDILLRAARRRVAARMDDSLSQTKQPLLSWEQFIFPVIISHPVMGDILRDQSGDPQDPSSYRVVLTPTCDMVPQASGCKVTHVLAGRCGPATSFISEGLSLAVTTGKTKVKERLEKALNEAHQSGLVLFPECPGTTPMMTLNLRALDLIPIESIGTNQTKGCSYIRVASLDSPFREYVAWAFLQISCRPGLPPKDDSAVILSLLDAWATKATGSKV